jgi:hypothetical protein
MKAVAEELSDVVVAVDVEPAHWLALKREHQIVRQQLKTKWLFRCPDCDHPVYPKNSPLGTQFFAHAPDAPDTCPLKALEGESAEHKQLKAEIYRAARRVSGWTAELEAKAPEADPNSGKPVVVDVVARRTRDTGTPGGIQPLQGWEVQLATIDDGRVLTRQELRERWLGRCTWVTRQRPRWSGRLPWYQVAQLDDDRHLVVDGVVRWDESTGDFVREDPFQSDAMVRYILRGALWVQDVGWQLHTASRSAAASQRQRRLALSPQKVRGVVAEYCDRMRALPESTRAWTDADWYRYAKHAHDRRAHGEKLSLVDRAALGRFPTLELYESDDIESLFAETQAFDALHDQKPCMICGEIAVTSASFDFPLHHHCAWHVARGDSCEIAS